MPPPERVGSREWRGFLQHACPGRMDDARSRPRVELAVRADWPPARVRVRVLVAAANLAAAVLGSGTECVRELLAGAAQRLWSAELDPGDSQGEWFRHLERAAEAARGGA